MSSGVSAKILAVNNLEVVYSDVVLALRGVSLEVPVGSIVAILGSNGAGKTTLLRAITGLLPVHRGRITKGIVEFDDTEVNGFEPARVVSRGLAQVMEGRRVFAELSVEENLRCGALARRDRSTVSEDYERILDLFPALRNQARQAAGFLSGGQQQMLAIGQALMASPKLLLLDEPSLGLAETVVRQIRDVIVQINASGTGVLLVEQNARMALSVSDHAYVLENGKVVRDGPSEELLHDRDIEEFYLGLGDAGRRSFRDVKTYRRKKRWGG